MVIGRLSLDRRDRLSAGTWFAAGWRHRLRVLPQRVPPGRLAPGARSTNQESAMPRSLKTWTVLPHGKLTEVEANILTVTGQVHMPLGDIPRRMTVVRLKDGRLVIWSA